MLFSRSTNTKPILPAGPEKLIPVPAGAELHVKVLYDVYEGEYKDVTFDAGGVRKVILASNGVVIEDNYGERYFAPEGSATLQHRTVGGVSYPPTLLPTPATVADMAKTAEHMAEIMKKHIIFDPSAVAPSTKGTTVANAKSANIPKPNDIDCWTLAEAVSAVSSRLLLYGPPGTGKSYGAARLGLRAGQEPVIITCTEDMSAIQLLGHFIPKGNAMEWMDGPIIKAWREGTRLVINEIDRASGDALTFFLGALDDPQTASMTLPNDRHELVRPKRGFTVVATMNGEPDTDLPAPLRDRFASTIHINAVHPAAISALPKDLQHAAKTSALVEDESRRISVRKWNEFAFLRDAFVQKHGEELGINMAAAAVFGTRANEAINAIRINKVGA